MPYLFPYTMRKSIGKRIAQMREAHAARELANGRKALVKWKFAKLVLGSNARVEDLDSLEEGMFALSEELLEAAAAALRVPAAWLKNGTADFQENDIVRIPGVGRRITEIRMTKGWSYIELSRRAALGHTSRNVARIEDDIHCPKLSTIQKIARALGVKPELILYG